MGRPVQPCGNCGSLERYLQPNGKYKRCPCTRQSQMRRYGHWAQNLITQAGKNSRKRKHCRPTIDRAWVLAQPLVCPYTRIALVPPHEDEHAGERCPWGPSLDRIDNTKGYTPENTRLTSWFWNCFRGSLPVSVALSHYREWLNSQLEKGLEVE